MAGGLAVQRGFLCIINSTQQGSLNGLKRVGEKLPPHPQQQVLVFLILCLAVSANAFPESVHLESKPIAPFDGCRSPSGLFFPADTYPYS